MLNYTTTIAADKTIGEIMGLLAKAGACSVMTDYDKAGAAVALHFLLRTRAGTVGYRLPANVDATLRVLTRQYEAGQVQRRFVSREQAARVSWRIIKDWVEAQLAIIATEMVDFNQVMLPYRLYAGRQTVYDAIIDGTLALPAPREREG